MANSTEPSSSISFTSSSTISKSPITHNNSSSSGSETGSNLEIISLNKLSSHLEQLLVDSNTDYSDAFIIVEGIEVGIHRCILAARSKFFNELFRREKKSFEKDGKLKYCMNDLLVYGNVGYEAFLIFLSYIYTGKLKASPLEVSTCIDNGCAHDSCRPAINFAIELMYASYVFQVPELVSLFQRRLLNFVGKALIEDVIPILLVSSHCNSTQLLTQCIDRVARSDLDSVALEKQLPFEIFNNIKSLRKKSKSDPEEQTPDPLLEKRIKRIHKALDSDDVELVRLLLTESDVTLDGAHALHYAAAYCDPKVFTEVLGLGLADVNKRDLRGYTVLHVAAMRKEPSVIVSLLTKGAGASDLTDDGQSAVSMCRRLIRPKDYYSKTEQGQAANKDRICVDVLEREVNRNPLAGDFPELGFLPTVADDLHMKLLYLENRVAFARLFFPTEAKLAMEIAHAETASQYPGILASNGSRSNLKEVDLNETPGMQNKRLQLKMENLLKTVEMGRRYFPHCSQVLDKFMEDDLPDLFYLEKGTQEEQKIKRMRFVELKADVQKAFNKDKADFHRSRMSTSASSSSMRESLNNKKTRKL